MIQGKSSQTRITLADIARAAKVHHTTVSRSLRNDPAISTETRKTVQALAESMGYKPDPMLSALASYRQREKPIKFKASIAWLTNFPEEHGWRYRTIMSEYLRGAKQRAEQLGYSIDVIWYPELVSKSASPERTLLARGIRGLLLPPQLATHTDIRLSWDQFAAVAFGFTLRHPHVHTVSNYQYASIYKLATQLASLGFKRIGLACTGKSDERLKYSWSAGFRAALTSMGMFSISLQHLPETLEKNQLLKWFRRETPDAIIVDAAISKPNDRLHPEQNKVYNWLLEEGASVPGDVSIAALALPEEETYFGGVTENALAVGGVAVDLLSGFLMRNDLGLPDVPTRTLIDGDYRQGFSIIPPGTEPS
jgi:DNA-binding LacI/PurR family transcriptional regulator